MPKFEFLYAFREMFHLRRMFFLLLLNLTLGMVSYLTLSTFRQGLRDVLLNRAKETLSSDMSFSVRRQFKPEELEPMKAELGPGVQESRSLEMMSMVVAEDESRLVQVKAIDDQYPLYGKLILKTGGRVTSESDKMILKQNAIWVYPEVLIQLKAEIGDKVSLGGQDFIIDDVVLEDSTQTFSFGALAPKIFMGLETIRKTTLVQFGSTLSDVIYFKIPDQERPLNELKQAVLDKTKDPAIDVITFQDANEQTSRFLTQLFDYLGLGALVGVSLSAFGLVALVQSWLQQKVKGYAISSALGMSAFQIQRIFLFQLFLVASSTLIISFSVVALGLPWITTYISQWISIPFDASLRGSAVLQGMALVFLGSLFLTLPFLRTLSQIPTQKLFSEGGSLSLDLDWRSVVRWLPAAIGFWGLAVFEVSSYRLGSIFFFSVVAVYFILAGLGWVLFQSLPRAIRLLSDRWNLAQGLLYLQRKPVMLITFVSLSLGTFLTVIVPQVRAGLKAELNPQGANEQPSLFLFDIQDEQLDPLKAFFEKSGYPLTYLSPLIRSRVLSINDQAYERAVLDDGFRTREEENEARFRNRGINLSFRPELAPSEKIIKGNPFSPTQDPDQPIELSVETRYADRMGFKIGDLIKMDIQGVEIEGKVINFREVKWSSFQPNFFILVHPQSLADAPKTWLANVKTSPEDRYPLQGNLAKQFPNVSAVDVVRLVQKISEITGQMTLALESMAWLTTISGLMVLLALLVRQLSLQRWDANLFRLLGAEQKHLRGLFVIQFGALVGFSCLSGAAVALIFARVLTWFLFEVEFTTDFQAVLISLAVIMAFGLGLAWQFARTLSKANPARLLQEVRL